MKMPFLFLILGLWAAAGYFNYGYTLGYFTHHYPDDENTGIAAAMAIAGPFGIPAVVFGGGTKHWLTKPKTTEERWQAFHALYPSLDRDYFERGED